MITQAEFDQILSNKDSSLILFYTDWCGGKAIIDDVYLTYLDKINKGKGSAQIILLESDDHISDTTIMNRRQQGFLSYRIHAGKDPYSNRSNIKNIIQEQFPDRHLEELDQFGFAIPFAILVNKDKKILAAGLDIGF